MSISNSPDRPLDLPQLLARFLQKQAATWPLAETGGEVELFQASSLYPVDARLAFQQAIEAAAYLLPAPETVAFDGKNMKAPMDWATMVRNQESLIAVPFCLGNYPQMLKNVSPLLAGGALTNLRPKKREAAEAIDQKSFAAKFTPAELLWKAALARLNRQWDSATSLLAAARSSASADWTGLILNEEAALAWQRGDCAKATAMWNKHPSPDNPAILFNRGVAELFGDNAQAAGTLLARAAEKIAPTSSWHDLVQLYRSVVAMQLAAAA